MSVEKIREVWDPAFPRYASGVDVAVVTAISAAIADVVNEHHDYEWWGSITTLTEMTGITTKPVRRALEHLTEVGVLQVIETRRGRTKRYRWAGLDGVDPGRYAPTSAGDPGRYAPGTQGATPPDTEKETETIQKGLLTQSRGELVERTPAQEADRIMRDYWAWIKNETGRHPKGISVIAFKSVITPFLEPDGWGVADVKHALRQLYEAGEPITRQSLERRLDGRARRRRRDDPRHSSLTGKAKRGEGPWFDDEGNLTDDR